MRRGILLGLLVACLASATALAEGTQVYVEDFSGNGASAAMRQTLARQFQAALMAADPAFKVFTRQNLRDLLQREEYKEVVACTEASCVTEIISNYGIALSAFGVVQTIGGGDCEVTISIFDREEPKWVGTEIGSCATRELVDTVRKLAQPCAAKLTGQPIAQQQQAQVQPQVQQQPSAVQRDEHGIEWVFSHFAGVEFTKTEITVAQYQNCLRAAICSVELAVANALRMQEYFGSLDSVGSGNCNTQRIGHEEYPVNCTTFEEAQKFCEWAGGRLPTEQEWRAEATGGGLRQYPWGNQEVSCDYAVWSDNISGFGCGRKEEWPVCSKLQGNSASGLCDMSGNVSEWASTSSANVRVRCGGNAGSNSQRFLRATDCDVQTLGNNWMQLTATGGFRCVRSPR